MSGSGAPRSVVGVTAVGAVLALAGCTAAAPEPVARSGPATVAPSAPPTVPAAPVPEPAVSWVLAAPRCAGARQVPVGVSAALLRGVRPARLSGTRAPAGQQGVALGRLLMSVDRYVLRTQLPTRWAAGAVTDMEQQLGGIRGASADAMALAVATETGGYDPGRAGRSAAFARAAAVWLVRSLACQHAAVRAGGWGAGDRPVPPDLHQWQSPMWAMQAGLAGWLLWPYLDETDRFRVAAMVVNEADRAAVVDPQYYGTAAGTVLTPGDTKAEEDAWMGPIFALAAAMMPTHPHARAWRRQEVRFELAAFATRADGLDRRAVHGAPLSRWLGGWNVLADGAVINHQRVHPAYAGFVAEGGQAVAVHALAAQAAPAADAHGLDTVYRGMLRTRFASPPYAAPGGTVYRPGSGDVYLPAGNDWGTLAATSQFVAMDAAAQVLRTAPEATGFLRRHAGVLAAMQGRAGDGRAYQTRAEALSPFLETVVAENVARSWLMEWAAANGRAVRTDDDLATAAAIPAADATGRAWTRFRPAREPAGRRPAADAPVLLAPAAASVPAVGTPVRARMDGGAVVLAGAALPHATVDVLVRSRGTPGYLVHVGAGAAVTVTRVADGRRTCGPLVVGRVDPACFDRRRLAGLVVVTAIDGGGPTAPLLAVAVGGQVG